VHRRYVSAALWEMSQREPVVLPPWDPMYALSRLNRTGAAF
jgi:aminopeptidase C